MQEPLQRQVSDEQGKTSKIPLPRRGVSCYNGPMSLYSDLQTASSEEDVKDIYIKQLHLKGYRKFWAIYDRPPKEEYRNYLLERRDSLIPTDERSFKGAYYMPQNGPKSAWKNTAGPATSFSCSSLRASQKKFPTRRSRCSLNSSTKTIKPSSSSVPCGKAEYLGGFVVRSKAFDGLQGDFPIGFLVWKTHNDVV